MKIFIGADHQGFSLKERLERLLRKNGYEAIDKGDEKLDPNDDFPIFAERVVTGMLADGNKDVRGILICGSGQGMVMAANRFKGVRACLAFDNESARSARNDDDSNILCLPASVLKQTNAEEIVRTWLETPFSGAPRYIRRIRQMDELG